MAYIVPSSPETLADQLLYTRGMLVEVDCGSCAAQVMVRKNSPHHTSIQWTREAVDRCEAFAEMEQSGDRPVHTGCPRLVRSIEAAVDAGRVPIGAGGADGVSDE